MRSESRENVEQFYSLAVYCWLAFEIQKPSNTLITRRSFSLVPNWSLSAATEDLLFPGSKQKGAKQANLVFFLQPVCLVMSCSVSRILEGVWFSDKPPPPNLSPFLEKERGPGTFWAQWWVIPTELGCWKHRAQNSSLVPTKTSAALEGFLLTNLPSWLLFSNYKLSSKPLASF